MLAITIELLLTVFLALAVLIGVTLPNLRSGSRLLTPDSERAVKRVRQQARRTNVAAAGSTRQGMLWLRAHSSR